MALVVGALEAHAVHTPSKASLSFAALLIQESILGEDEARPLPPITLST